jgi:hypothetical protein
VQVVENQPDGSRRRLEGREHQVDELGADVSGWRERAIGGPALRRRVDHLDRFDDRRPEHGRIAVPSLEAEPHHGAPGGSRLGGELREQRRLAGTCGAADDGHRCGFFEHRLQ